MHEQSDEKCEEKKYSEKPNVNPAQIDAVSQTKIYKKS